MGRRVYIACSLAYSGQARALHEILVGQGHDVVSSWHETTETKDPDDASVREAILATNINDLHACDALVALTAHGVPRGTLCEIGFALARRVPVIWVHGSEGEGRNIFDAHPLVLRTDNLFHIPALLDELDRASA